jgi:ectoine hydroxylase-related dioxygenase (phytanoyl-CoA dioxygenase family)
LKDGIIYAHAPKEALSQVVALRFHLDDCSTHNGPLKVLPESHKEGVLSDQDIEAFCTRIKAVDCVVPRGGILAMSPLLIHSSSKSLEGSRRVLHIEYAASADLGQGLELAIT